MAKVVRRGEGVLKVSPPLPPENFNHTPPVPLGLIQKEAHRAVVAHWYGYSLQLPVCNTVKSVKHFSDTVYEITN